MYIFRILVKFKDVRVTKKERNGRKRCCVVSENSWIEGWFFRTTQPHTVFLFWYSIIIYLIILCFKYIPRFSVSDTTKRSQVKPTLVLSCPVLSCHAFLTYVQLSALIWGFRIEIQLDLPGSHYFYLFFRFELCCVCVANATIGLVLILSKLNWGVMRIRSLSYFWGWLWILKL